MNDAFFVSIILSECLPPPSPHSLFLFSPSYRAEAAFGRDRTDVAEIYSLSHFLREGWEKEQLEHETYT